MTSIITGISVYDNEEYIGPRVRKIGFSLWYCISQLFQLFSIILNISLLVFSFVQQSWDLVCFLFHCQSIPLKKSRYSLKKNTYSWDFTGGPVVKNLPSNAGDSSLLRGWGTKIPHATCQLYMCCSYWAYTQKLRPHAAKNKEVLNKTQRWFLTTASQTKFFVPTFHLSEVTPFGKL